MKKIILFTFFLATFALFNLAQAQKALPKFSFFDLEGKTFTSANLKTGVPTIVFFYDPYCEHCNLQADWINNSYIRVKGMNLVWVSTEEAGPIQEFKKNHFSTNTWDKLYFLRDSGFKFDNYFGYTEAPGIYLYDKNGVLVKDFRKETPTSDLLRPLGL